MFDFSKAEITLTNLLCRSFLWTSAFLSLIKVTNSKHSSQKKNKTLFGNFVPTGLHNLTQMCYTFSFALKLLSNSSQTKRVSLLTNMVWPFSPKPSARCRINLRPASPTLSVTHSCHFLQLVLSYLCIRQCRTIVCFNCA